MIDKKNHHDALAEDIIFDGVLQKCNQYAFSYMPDENVDS